MACEQVHTHTHTIPRSLSNLNGLRGSAWILQQGSVPTAQLLQAPFQPIHASKNTCLTISGQAQVTKTMREAAVIPKGSTKKKHHQRTNMNPGHGYG